MATYKKKTAKLIDEILKERGEKRLVINCKIYGCKQEKHSKIRATNWRVLKFIYLGSV